MGGEDVVDAGGFEGFFKAKALALDEETDAFESEKSRVAFVHVEDGGLEVHGFKRAHAADAENDFLADARVVIAAVKLARDPAIFRARIFGRVGIEEEHLDPAHVDGPQADYNRAGGEADGYGALGSVAIERRLHGQGIEVVFEIAFLLPAIGIQVLAEVTELIEQGDADEREIEIAGGLHVIAGEDAEAARVNGQAFGESIFGRKIGDHFAIRVAGRILHVRIEALAGELVLGDVARVGGHLFEGGLGNTAQHYDGVIAGFFPESGVETAEQGADGRFPRPENVLG